MKEKKHAYKFHYLLHSSTLIEKCLTEKLMPLGLGPRQARIICYLDHMGETSQIDLARECDITAASMSTMTSRMISAGYISRVTDPLETRRNTLSLTKTGIKLIDGIKKAWTEVDIVIEKSIGVENSKILRDLTKQLRNSLGGHAPGEKQ